MKMIVWILPLSALSAQTLVVPGGTVGDSHNGNVGIGVAAPEQKLAVAVADSIPSVSTANSIAAVGASGKITAIGTNSAYGWLQSYNGPLFINVAGNNTILNGAALGNVGIGTVTPNTHLEVAGPAVAAPLWQSEGIRVSVSGHSAGFGVDASSSNWGVSLFQDGAKRLTVDSNGGGLIGSSFVGLNAPPNGLAVEGKVGIGTTAPQKILHISEPGTGDMAYTADGQFNYLQFGDGSFSAGKSLRFTGPNGSGLMDVVFAASGNVGIGTTNPTQKLSVNGTVRAKEVVVETAGWSDYVLAKDYALAPLSEVEQHIQKEGHLPGIPSAQEVAEKGVGVGEMQAKLLAKIEELTLHVIEQQKRIERLTEQNAELNNRVKAVEAR